MNKIFLTHIPSFKTTNPLTRSLEYYEKITHKHIVKNRERILKKINIPPQYLMKLLKDPDVFANLTTALMLADASWDTTKSSMFYWRNVCLCTCLGNMLNYADKRTRIYSKNAPKAYTRETPAIEYEKIERFEQIQKSLKVIKRKHRRMVQDYYYNGITQTAIAKKYKLHPSRINHILKAWARKLKPELINLI